MIKKTLIICVWLAFLLSFGIAACDPPNGGFDQDWTINAGENCTNTSIQLNITGNVIVNGNLTLNSVTMYANKTLNVSGNLTVNNTILLMNGTSDGASTIYVLSSGRMEVMNYSMINSTNADIEYYFEVQYGSEFEMNDSRIEECGFNVPNFGLTIFANNVNITNSNFTNNYRSIYIRYANQSRILNNIIKNSSHTAIIIDGNHSPTWPWSYPEYCHNHTFVGNTIIDTGNTTVNTYGFNAEYIQNSTMSNNIIYNTSNHTILFGAIADIVVENNRLYDCQDLVYGCRNFYCDYCHNVTFNNNSLWEGYGGVVFYFGFNNTISNNVVENHSEYGIAINREYGFNASSNNISNTSKGISIANINDSSFTSNIISNTTIGFSVTFCDNNLFTSNYITNSTSIGMLLNQSASPTLNNNTIGNSSLALTLTGYSTLASSIVTGIYSNNTFSADNGANLAFNNINMTLQDIVIPNASSWNVTLSNNSQVTFINVTTGNESINVSGTSMLTRRWYLNVRTRDASGDAVDGALVRAINSQATQEFRATTRASGWIVTQTPREYEQNSTTYIYYNFYTVSASKSGYTSTSSAAVTLTNNNRVVLTLSAIGGYGGYGGGGTTPPDDSLDVETFDTNPAFLPCYIPRGGTEIYEYIEVIGPPKEMPCISEIRFTVERSWLQEQGIDPTDIVLTRFHDGVWSEVPTFVIGEDAHYVRYKALSPTLDYFGVKGEKEDCRDTGCDEGQTCFQQDVMNGTYLCVDISEVCGVECPSGHTPDIETCACRCTRTCPQGQVLGVGCVCYEPEAAPAAGIDMMWLVVIGAIVAMIAAAYYGYKE